MSPTPVQIMSRRPEAASSTVVSQHAQTPEPVGIVITTVDQISAGNQRGCGDHQPYGD